MKVVLKKGDFKTYVIFNLETKESILFDSDLDWPILAFNLGFLCCECLEFNGLIDCEHKTESEMIIEARIWLDNNIGIVVEDPGFFEEATIKNDGPHHIATRVDQIMYVVVRLATKDKGSPYFILQACDSSLIAMKTYADLKKENPDKFFDVLIIPVQVDNFPTERPVGKRLEGDITQVIKSPS